MPGDNPILSYYKGKPIRKCNRVVLKLNSIEFKKLLEEVDATGLSIKKIISHLSKGCEKCKDPFSKLFDKEGRIVKIRKDIFHVPENHGINIIQQANRHE